MRKKSRIAAIVLTSAMVIGTMTGCGNSKSADVKETKAEEAAAQKTGKNESEAASGEAVTFTVTADVTGDRAPYVDQFVKLVEEKTNQRYKGNVIAAGSLGSGADAAQMLQMGTLDVLMSDDMTMDGVLDGALGFAWLPGLVADYDEADKYYNNGWIAQEVGKIMEQNELIRISSFCNGFRQVGNIKRPITEMADLQGLKIRTPSVESVVNFYEKCGALPVMISGSEVLNALQTGAVDGLDNAVFNYTNQGITDVITHITELNYCYSGGCFIAGKSFWDTLSDEDRAIFKACAQEASDDFTHFFREKTEKLTKEGVDNGQWTVEQPSAAMKETLKGIYKEIWEESRGKYSDEIMDAIISGDYKTKS